MEFDFIDDEFQFHDDWFWFQWKIMKRENFVVVFRVSVLLGLSENKERDDKG